MQTSKSLPRLNENFTLEHFVVGASNEFAYSAAKAVAAAPGKTDFNPLLIYGRSGLGKTHLLQSIGNHILKNDPSRTVIYTSSEEFRMMFVDALQNGNIREFSTCFRESDVLLMDDIQFLAGWEKSQEELFHIYNTLHMSRKQIVLTSDVPPAALKGLENRLTSRFQSGLSVDILPPDLEMRVAILNKKTETWKLNLPEEILYYIGENVSSNIRALEGAIRIIYGLAITKGGGEAITLDLAKYALKDTVKTPEISKISIDRIIEKTAAFYNVPVNNVLEKNKRKEVALCRQVAMYISKKLTNHSLKSIGLNFGGRDHSTVIHAVEVVEELLGNDTGATRDVETIIASLKQ
ncbi:MAG: chromosomal replication initiator protein DnaA [Chitinispirillales bacterium]|jgi:chromosomal replication initiator protein|nr:chromosomal replication initiator protein DnaA [Chitinispirillales bacterium]